MTSYAEERKIFLCIQYVWISKIFNNINEGLHSVNLNNITKSQPRLVLRLIHHRYLTGNIQFNLKHNYPHYNISFTSRDVLKLFQYKQV